MGWEHRFEEMVSEAADTWASKANRLACSGIFSGFRLWYRPANGAAWGALELVPLGDPVPDGMLSAADDVVGSHFNRERTRALVHRIARRLPVIGEGR